MSDIDPAKFTHLHVHSHASLLQATPTVTRLAQQAAAARMPALALTDSHGLYGVVAFAQACHAAGIQPIVGMSVTVASPLNGQPLPGTNPVSLVLLAEGPKGYRSLCRLAATLQAHPDRRKRLAQGVSWNDLKAYHEGLLCIEAGLSGWLAHYLRMGQTQEASRYAGRLGAIFADHCYLGLELQRPEDTALARQMIYIGERFGMPPVVAQPVYCLDPAKKALLPLLATLESNCLLADVPEPVPDSHWLEPEEIGQRFAGFPEALTNVGRVIARCQSALPSGDPIWPALNLPKAQRTEQALIEQATAGLKARLADSPPRHDSTGNKLSLSSYETRLSRELASINAQGFAPLFLLVADLVRYAQEQDIPVSTRGSVANSLVAYVLNITTIDPLEHGLLFERFLHPARANMPDIDLDFCSRRRDEVLAYMRSTYGQERVALVGTMNTLQPKSAVRGVAKAYGLGEQRLKQLSALVPRHWHPDPRRRELPDIEPVLAQLEDETEQTIIRQAFQLVGQPHHLSLHPGGIVITPGPLTDLVPIQWAAKGFLVTQFDYRDVEAIGLPKIDLLGIRALTVLADAAESVRHQHDDTFRLAHIPLNDSATGDLLALGETIGVFQCESSGAQRTLRQLKARSVRDLAVANAFFKPGPATGGMAQAFVRRYRGQEAVSFLHPALAPILQPTQGVLLFQEQVLRIAVEIAGLSWQQADHLRRGMSKFQAREMAAMRAAFVSGCRRSPPQGPGFDKEQADLLWGQVMAFAGYGFNQGHATAYADVSYRSAYLKTHYPAEFLRARLMDRGGFHHPAIYLAEARRLGLAVRPPHVNVSGAKMSLTYGDPTAPAGLHQADPVLWLGLSQVRQLRRRSISTIQQQRPFASLRLLLERVPLQTKEIRHLIQCGALDGLGSSRAAMLTEGEEIARAGSARQLAFSFTDTPQVPTESTEQRLAWEKELLGMPISANPLSLVDWPAGAPLAQLSQQPGQRVTVNGIRLPGWTGGRGWFLSDGESFLIARGGRRPVAWQPVRLTGRYRLDEWDSGWFQIEE